MTDIILAIIFVITILVLILILFFYGTGSLQNAYCVESSIYRSA